MPNLTGDLNAYLASLSPAALVARYGYLTEHPDLVESNIYGAQDNANLFAFQLAKQTLGRVPTPAEVVSGTGTLTAGNVAQILAATPPTTAPPGSTVDTAGGIMAPGTSSPTAITMDTATAGGTPTAFASQYSFGGGPLDLNYAGSSANAIAAPPSDNSMLWVLAGAAIILFGVFKHG